MRNLVDYRDFVENNNIKVTIFIVTYNRCEQLLKSVESVINQTYKEIAIVILDNASTDNTMVTMDKISDKRCFYYCHEKNLGGIGNINSAISLSNTEFFMIFHDDDIMCDTLVEEEYMAISNNPFDAVSSRALFVDEDGHPYKNKNKETVVRTFKESQYVEFVLKGGESCIFPTVMYRTDFIRANNLYLVKEVGPCCDLFLLSEICMNHGLLMILDKKLIIRRCHPEQDSVKSEFWMNMKVLNYFSHNIKYRPIMHDNSKYYLNAYLKYMPHLLANLSEHKVTSDIVDDVISGIDISICKDNYKISILKFVLWLDKNFRKETGLFFSVFRKFLRSIK